MGKEFAVGVEGMGSWRFGSAFILLLTVYDAFFHCFEDI